MTQGARAPARFWAAGLEAKPTVYQSLAADEMSYTQRDGAKTLPAAAEKYRFIIIHIDFMI